MDALPIIVSILLYCSFLYIAYIVIKATDKKVEQMRQDRTTPTKINEGAK